MADYLIDTNILAYWHDSKRSQHANVLARVARSLVPDPATGYVSRRFVSVISVAEVAYGHAVTPAPNAAAQADYRSFIATQLPPPLDVTVHIQEPYAKLRAWLFHHCSPRNRRAKRAEELVDPTTARELGIDENDLWIAAHAALYGFVLVTADRLSNLARAIDAAGVGPTVEDWTSP